MFLKARLHLSTCTGGFPKISARLFWQKQHQIFVFLHTMVVESKATEHMLFGVHAVVVFRVVRSW